MNSRHWQLGLLILIGLAGGSGCRRATQPGLMTLSGMTMGTQYSIKFHGLPADVDQTQLHMQIQQRLQQINKQMSTYDPDSELSRFNRRTDDAWFPVSKETALVVATALEISRKTDGAFDITVGPLVNLWNFGPDPQPDRFPTEEQIHEATSRVGYQNIESRLTPPALRKHQGDAYLDLSSIAKGFAVDDVAEMLAERGVDGFMVEIGGEVRTQGTKSDGTAWRIGIEKPISDGRAVHQVVNLTNCSLATSGDYRNFLEIDGRRYSHEIDPRTGYPVDHGLTSVSVITDRCMLADAWATALIVAGPDRAMRLAEENNLDMMLIERTEGEFRDRATTGFAKYLQPREPAP